MGYILCMLGGAFIGAGLMYLFWKKYKTTDAFFEKIETKFNEWQKSRK